MNRLRYRQSAFVKRFHFIRIVGYQPNGADAKRFENLQCRRIIPFVAGKTEFEIGFNGIKSRILQAVRFQFIDQPDSAPFLSKINDNTASFFFNRFHGAVKLSAAITPQP